MSRVALLLDQLRSSLWFVPAVFVAASVLLAQLTLTIDAGLTADASARFFLYGGDADSARSMLSAIATALLSFTGLVFTVTMLVLQLASSQLSPRVMRTFLRDRGNQAVLGVFVGTLVYALLVLRAVRSDPEGFVPGLSVWIAILLLLGSVAAFIYYIDHMAHAIRATEVMDRVVDETRQAIEQRYPDAIGEQPPPPAPLEGSPGSIVRSPRSGVVARIDEERLQRMAVEHDAVFRVLPEVGDWVTEGGNLVEVWRVPRLPEGRDPASAVTIASERTTTGDPAFGFRQLIDIGLRALSLATNDPTTAVQVIDRIEVLLRQLLERAIPPVERRGQDGARVLIPQPDWDRYVRLATNELADAARDQPRVVMRLAQLLDGLIADADASRQPALRRARMELPSPDSDQQDP